MYGAMALAARLLSLRNKDVPFGKEGLEGLVGKELLLTVENPKYQHILPDGHQAIGELREIISRDPGHLEHYYLGYVSNASCEGEAVNAPTEAIDHYIVVPESVDHSSESPTLTGTGRLYNPTTNEFIGEDGCITLTLRELPAFKIVSDPLMRVDKIET